MKYKFVCAFVVLLLLTYFLMKNVVAKKKPGAKTTRQLEIFAGINKKLKEAGKGCMKSSQKIRMRIKSKGETQHHYPWMVAIYMYPQDTNATVEPVCGGSLITREYVLTAARCVHAGILRNESESDLVEAEEIFVRLGDLNLMSPHDDQQRSVLTVKVHEIIPHELYDKVSSVNDIALIRLKKAVKYTKYIAPVCISGLNTPVIPWTRNAAVITIGWGLEGKNSSDSHILKEGQLTLWPNSYCEHKIQHQMDEEFICAGSWKNTVSVCPGDEGGPLMPIPNMLLPVIIGIASFGLSCANDPYAFTNVTHYIEWINENAT